MISIIADPKIVYPDAKDFFSPDEKFPEYRFEHISTTENPVYRAVRDSFAQANLDKANLGTPVWNPLGDFVQPGSRVFVLCNFVIHQASNETTANFRAKCTHGSVLRALIDYLLLAVGKTGTISFGNAPMQNCHWDSVLRETEASVVEEFYQENKVPVKAKDLRLFVIEKNRLGGINKVEKRPEENGIAIDLGADSLFADSNRSLNSQYRIMNYSSKRLESLHGEGKHTYVINREILESDVIVSLPKLKTHEKVGITCALKGFVGTVGHKDSLPHHSFGTPKIGGDEYPTDTPSLIHRVSAFHDRVQKTRPGSTWGNMMRFLDKVARRLSGKWAPVAEGAWWGNDTTWRMVLDLARIATFGTISGSMQSDPQRKHLVLIDGVVGGEGQGPLFPTAVPSGTLLFCDNLVATDYACALMMGIDPEPLPLIQQAIHLSKYPLIDHKISDEYIIHNGKELTLQKLTNLSPHHFEPPLGWEGKL